MGGLLGKGTVGSIDVKIVEAGVYDFISWDLGNCGTFNVSATVTGVAVSSNVPSPFNISNSVVAVRQLLLVVNYSSFHPFVKLSGTNAMIDAKDCQVMLHSYAMLVKSNEGRINIKDTIFRDLSWNGIIMSVSGASECRFYNVLFENIISFSSFANVINVGIFSDFLGLNVCVDGCFFNQIESKSEVAEMGGLFGFKGGLNSVFEFKNNTFINCIFTGRNGGCMNLNLSGNFDGSFVICDCKFLNINTTGYGKGAVLYLYATEDTSLVRTRISGCNFSDCHAYYGGVAYLNLSCGITMPITHCRFLGNRAGFASHGHDVYSSHADAHGPDSEEAYIGSCSDSSDADSADPSYSSSVESSSTGSLCSLYAVLFPLCPPSSSSSSSTSLSSLLLHTVWVNGDSGADSRGSPCTQTEPCRTLAHAFGRGESRDKRKDVPLTVNLIGTIEQQPLCVTGRQNGYILQGRGSDRMTSAVTGRDASVGEMETTARTLLTVAAGNATSGVVIELAGGCFELNNLTVIFLPAMNDFVFVEMLADSVFRVCTVAFKSADAQATAWPKYPISFCSGSLFITNVTVTNRVLNGPFVFMDGEFDAGTHTRSHTHVHPQPHSFLLLHPHPHACVWTFDLLRFENLTVMCEHPVFGEVQGKEHAQQIELVQVLRVNNSVFCNITHTHNFTGRMRPSPSPSSSLLSCGAVFSQGSSETGSYMKFDNCSFKCITSESCNGVIRVNACPAAMDSHGAFTVVNSVFDTCRTFSVGALFIVTPTPCNIQNTVFRNNTHVAPNALGGVSDVRLFLTHFTGTNIAEAFNAGNFTGSCSSSNVFRISASTSGPLSASVQTSVSLDAFLPSCSAEPKLTVAVRSGESERNGLRRSREKRESNGDDDDDAENVTYLDTNGSLITAVATPITADTTVLSASWYYVENTITFNDRLTVVGEVNLILADGCTLVVVGWPGNIRGGNPGIHISAGAHLVIHGQSNSSGILNVLGGHLAAGIGGGPFEDGGAVTVNGGRVEATGGKSGAAIGGGFNGNGGTVIVNGGTVVATGGENAAAIGGGDVEYEGTGRGGTFVINGGTVEATSISWGAAIGGGYLQLGGMIVINGGTVVAKGGTSGGAGIGGGYCGEGGVIIINGGTVTATSQWGGAGIGGGSQGLGGTITINNGTVYAACVEGGAGIGTGLGGFRGSSTIITINNGTVNATGGLYSAGIGGGRQALGSFITIRGGTVNATGGNYGLKTGERLDGGGAGIGGGAKGKGDGCTITIEGGTVYATGGTDGAGIGGGWEGQGGVITIRDGTVNATGTMNGAGIGGGWKGQGGVITIEDGTVVATSGQSAAAIGCGSGINEGTVAISGGTVVAKGGDHGVGIGGGSDAVGGKVTVTIINGSVTAEGGLSAAGIGCNNKGGEIAITIEGGTVEAKGGDMAAGIGSSLNGGGRRTVSINGGTVVAAGGISGAGVGTGASGEDGIAVTITGGTIRAVGGGDGAMDIGTGNDNHGNDTGTLKDGDNQDVFLNTLTVGAPAVAGRPVTAAIIGEFGSYCVNDVVTDGEGKVYFYLPPNLRSNEIVELTVDNLVYQGRYRRLANHNNTHILHLNYFIDTAAVEAAKALIEGSVYSGTHANIATIAEAKAKVEAILAGLRLDGVGTTVVDGAFVEARVGTSDNPLGRDGYYTFNVTLNKGVALAETTELTLTVAASAYYHVVVNGGSTGGSAMATPAGALAGSTIILTTLPDVDYTLQSLNICWGSGVEFNLGRVENPFLFTMPSSDVTVTATFVLLETKGEETEEEEAKAEETKEEETKAEETKAGETGEEETKTEETGEEKTKAEEAKAKGGLPAVTIVLIVFVALLATSVVILVGVVGWTKYKATKDDQQRSVEMKDDSVHRQTNNSTDQDTSANTSTDADTGLLEE